MFYVYPVGRYIISEWEMAYLRNYFGSYLLQFYLHRFFKNEPAIEMYY